LFINDIGTTIRLRLRNNTISSSDTVRIYYRTPSNVFGYWVGAVDGHNSIVYRIQSGDITEPGNWQIQGWISRAYDEWSGYTSIVTLPVQNDLEGSGEI
jgi:hypothetical protein